LVTPQGLLTYEEDKTLVALVLGMQDLGFSLPYNIPKPKVKELTQTRLSPFKAGLLKNN
jgi:hypothetical protein